VYPIGVISMMDSGCLDDKIIAIPFNDPTYSCYRGIEALPSHIFTEMKHFYKVYKELESKETVVDEIRGHKEAVRIVKNAIEKYKQLKETI